LRAERPPDLAWRLAGLVDMASGDWDERLILSS
jgi:hypothetical protein